MPLRSGRFPLIFSLLIAAGIALSACGSNDPPKVPRSIIITAPPIPVGTLVAGCSTSELEAWLEVAASLTNRFSIESLAALDQPPETVPDTLSRQIDLIDRIVAEPVPECAVTAQAAIVQRLRAIHAAFLAFDEAGIDGEMLRARVTEQQVALDTEGAALLADLEAGLEELYRLDAQAAAPDE